MKEKYRKLYAIIFILSIILRIPFALVNTVSNDDHMEVINIIKDDRRVPVREDCWQCYQPKLYHVFVAILLGVFQVENQNYQIIFAQLINGLVGMITLYIVYFFLKKFQINEKIKLIGFSLLAFNPKLIGINAQATNDSFVILFSTLTIYFTWLFLNSDVTKNFIFMTLSTILAGLSKGNGLILFFVLVPILSVKLFLERKSLKKRKNNLKFIFLFLFIFLLITPYFGQYLEKYFKYGSPFIINVDKSPKPHLFRETFIEQPGVTSIVNSYFTFRFFDLIKNPITTGDIWYGDKNPYPRHRTSLWTQLYGRAHFIHFNLWPPILKVDNMFILTLGRLIFILALIPSLVLLYGLYIALYSLIDNIKKKNNDFFIRYNWIFIIFFLAFISFIVLNTHNYRDFSSMKIIFIYPGMLAFLKLFINGLNRIYKEFGEKSKILTIINFSLISLIVCYIINVITLLIQLSISFINIYGWTFKL